jgi:hypothetical protein
MVIDIDDGIYETLKDNIMTASGLRSGKTIMSCIYMAVANGTPIPRGCGDLIDVNSVDTRYSDPEVAEALSDAQVIIKADDSTTDKKGEWVIKYHGFPPEPTTVCSECGFDRDFNIRTRGFGKIKYCPNCGCRMNDL